MKTFSLLTTLAGLTSATNVLLPLYIYPYPSSVWTPVFNAITANPKLNFQIVINPNSGPDNMATPNSDFAPNLAKLNGYSNVQTIGYVHTSYGNRAISDLKKDIALYAGWSTPSSPNVAVKGIFFDETSNTADVANYTYMQTLSNYVYQEIGSSSAVIFNMGATPQNTNHYGLATNIITAELAGSSYQNQTTIGKIPAGYGSKSSILVHSYTGTAPNLKSLLGTLAANLVQGAYFTSDTDYQSVTTGVGNVTNVAAGLSAANAAIVK